MKDKLIDRYLYAVAKQLPEKIRKDVEEELRSLILDMAEERSNGGEVTEEIMLEVLEELGHPVQMADKYQPEGSKALISEPYYGDYIYVLKIVAACVLAGVGVSWLVGLFTAPGGVNITLYTQKMPDLMTSIFQGLCAVFTSVTLLFAAFQRNGAAINIRKNTSIRDLPDVPDEKAQIKKSEAAVQIIFGVLFPVIFLTMPGFGYLLDTNGDVGYIFHEGNIRAAWPLLILIAVVSVAQGIMALYEGRYTKRYAISYGVTNLISLGLFLAFWLGREIFHPDFVVKMGEVLGSAEEGRQFVMDTLPRLVVGLMVIVTLVEVMSVAWKAWKYDRA